MNSMKRVVTGVLAAAMIFGLTATALADDSGAVAPQQPSITAPATVNPGHADPAKRADREARQAFKKGMEAERNKLKEQQGILQSLREELKVKLEQVKALVAQARQSGDRKALLKARADRMAIQAHVQVVREKTETNKALWPDLKAAVQARDLKEATRIAGQLIANRQVKIEALRDMSLGFDRLIEDLKDAVGGTPAPAQTPAVN